jgi:hypothetical protein
VANPYSTMLNGGTNFIAAGTTNGYAPVIFNPYFLAPPSPNCTGFGCEEFTNAGVQIDFTPLTAGTGNVTFRIARSGNNGNSFESVPGLAVVVPLNNSTAPISYFATIDLQGASNFNLVSAENPTGVVITNVTAMFNLKSPKFGARQATR